MRFTWVPLTSRTTTQLVINTAAFVTLCTNDTKSTKIQNTFTKFDIGTTTGHVGRNRNGTTLTRIHDDMGFFFVVLGIKHFVRNTCFNQHLRNQVRCFNGNGTNKNWLTLFITTFDILHYRTEFGIQGWVKKIIMVNTLNWTVGWNRNDSHVIDFTELIFLGLTCTSHT